GVRRAGSARATHPRGTQPDDLHQSRAGFRRPLGAIGQNAPGYGQRKNSGVAQAGSAIADAGRRQAEHSAVLQRCAVVNGAPGGRMRNTQAHWGLFFTAGQRIEFARRFSATTQSAMRAIALSLALAVLPLSA